MFGKWKNLANLRKGLEQALTSSFFGIPEVLVVHDKYSAALIAILTELSQYKIRIIVLSLDPDIVCKDCASAHIRDLIEKSYPGAPSLVTVKYFGIPKEYVKAVTAKVEASY